LQRRLQTLKDGIRDFEAGNKQKTQIFEYEIHKSVAHARLAMLVLDRGVTSISDAASFKNSLAGRFGLTAGTNPKIRKSTYRAGNSASLIISSIAS
jgi:hypothetical protein